MKEYHQHIKIKIFFVIKCLSFSFLLRLVLRTLAKSGPKRKTSFIIKEISVNVFDFQFPKLMVSNVHQKQV